MIAYIINIKLNIKNFLRIKKVKLSNKNSNKKSKDNKPIFSLLIILKENAGMNNIYLKEILFVTIALTIKNNVTIFYD